MKQIKVTTIMEIDDNLLADLTDEKIYDYFLDLLEDTIRTEDVTAFDFEDENGRIF